MARSHLARLNLLQGLPPGRFSQATCRHGQPGAMVGSPQLSRQEENCVAERREGGPLKRRGQAELREPVDQVVGPQEERDVGLVGEEGARGNAAHGVIPREWFAQQLDPGTVGVPAPEGQRSHWPVRAENLVLIRAQLAQREWGSRFLGLGPADTHETRSPRPMGRLIPTLGDLAAALAELVKAGGETETDFSLAILQNYRAETSTDVVLKEIVSRFPNNDRKMGGVRISINSTGEVSGEFGLAEAWRIKKESLTQWLTDERREVKAFAETHIAELDRMIASERRRVEAEREMRDRSQDESGYDHGYRAKPF